MKMSSDNNGLSILGDIASYFDKLPTNYNLFKSSELFDDKCYDKEARSNDSLNNVLSIGELVNTRGELSHDQQVPTSIVATQTNDECIGGQQVDHLSSVSLAKKVKETSPSNSREIPSEVEAAVEPKRRTRRTRSNTSPRKQRKTVFPSPTVSRQDNHDSDLEDRPYVCTSATCSWSFKRKPDLIRHMKKHEIPKYECPYHANNPLSNHKGGSTFTRLDVLKRHLRSIHFAPHSSDDADGIGQCKACLVVFNDVKSFTDHCEECSKSAVSLMTPESSTEPEN